MRALSIECHHEEAGGRRGDLFLFQRVMGLFKIKLDIIYPEQIAAALSASQ